MTPQWTATTLRARVAHGLGVAGALLLAALLLAPAALAHARYDHSTPSPGQVLPTSPARVDIYTVQEMQKTQGAYGITVQRDDNGTPGAEVDSGDTVMDDSNRSHFYVDLQPNLPPGRYLVSFHNVSDEDGDADHGQFAFYVGTGPTPAQQQLDRALQITSATTATATTAAAAITTKSGGSRAGVVAGIVIAAAIVLGAAAGGYVYATRRHPPA